MRSLWLIGLVCIASVAAIGVLEADNSQLFELSPLLYSAFWETEINFGSEGGMYAQMIVNYDFETLGRGRIPPVNPADQSAAEPPMGLDPGEPAAEYQNFQPWSVIGSAQVSTYNQSQPFKTNPTVLRIQAGAGEWGVSNPGYWGINVVTGNQYNLKFYALTSGISSVTARLRGAAGGAVLATTTFNITSASNGWMDFFANMTANGTNHAAVLELVGEGGSGTLFIDGVSLFPGDAVAGLFRPDIFAYFEAMNPGFMRCPGGNYLEGTGQRTRWNWKNTLGQREARSGHYNSAWGYWVTDGVGLYELLILAEALGTQAQLSIYTGYSMGQPYIPLDQSQVFAQDAVDLVQFAIGAANTTWGAQRAAMGHAAPFVLNRLEVGNEESLMGPSDYPAHYKLITQAVWAQYPDMFIVASGFWGPSLTGSPCLTGQRCDEWDNHYYRSPDQMASMAHQFDNYNRSLPDIFVGEFAATVGNQPTLQAAVSEAMFMLGFEANGDKVKASSFAPLMNNVNGTQWSYNLINFDSYRVYAMPSYAAQLLLSHNRGDYICESSFRGIDDGIATVSVLEADNVVILKMAHYSPTPDVVNVTLSNFGSTLGPSATMITLTSSEGAAAQNTLDNPWNVVPVSSPLAIPGSDFVVPLPAWSVVVVLVPFFP